MTIAILNSASSKNKDGKIKCVICLPVLSNDAIKPSKLRRHLDTKHPGCAQKSKSLFERERGVPPTTNYDDRINHHSSKGTASLLPDSAEDSQKQEVPHNQGGTGAPRSSRDL